MIEPFVWMFKQDVYFVRNLLIYLIFFILSSVSIFCLTFVKSISFISSIIPILFIVFFIFNLLCLAGYFNIITTSIIHSKKDVVLSNIYDGKATTTYSIELPDFNFLNLLWRGIATVVAYILSSIPLVILLVLLFLNVYFFPEIFTQVKFIILFIVIYLLYLLFLPLMFWNYSSTNSVFAVFNFSEMIFIFGNYTLRYIKNAFLLAFMSVIFTIFQFGIKLLVAMLSSNLLIIIAFIIAIVLFLMFIIYNIYVCAYLIGTIVPRESV